jgi:hypothetical protein
MALAGCGSYWDLRKGESLDVGCAGLLNFYPDADGDKWGEPGSIATQSCTADVKAGLTASNDLDCDDSDPGITGKAAAICPQQMVLGLATCVQGTRQGESEFVGTCGETPRVDFDDALQDCQAWAGWETPEAVDAGMVGHRGLAALETEFEYNEISDWLTAQAGTEQVALWVDLRWTGTVSEGAWQWPDGTEPTFVPPCEGAEATPGDFWPDLLPGDGKGDDAVATHLDEVREALVFDGTAWCRGVPTLIGWQPREGYALCERPSPDLVAYEDSPEQTEDDGPPGPGE